MQGDVQSRGHSAQGGLPGPSGPVAESGARDFGGNRPEAQPAREGRAEADLQDVV